MKVTTESCLFGSLIESEECASILDIGAGTGLLSLMVAQRLHKARVIAIEIDEEGARQCSENFENSPWSDRLIVVNAPVQKFESSSGFDLIISNPPFFKGSMRSSDTRKNIALHNEALDLDQLVFAVDRLLAEKGKAWILLPAYEMAVFTKKMETAGLFPHQYIEIFNRPGDKVLFRKVVIFDRSGKEEGQRKITIRDSAEEYTEDFKNLLKPYYLHLD